MPLAIDVKGIALARFGSVSIIKIGMSNISRKVWLIGVTVLGSKAVDHIDQFGRTLRTVLQTPSRGLETWLTESIQCQKWCWCLFFFFRKGGEEFGSLPWGLPSTYLHHWVGRTSKMSEEPSFLPERRLLICFLWEAPRCRIVAYCAQDVASFFQFHVVLKTEFGRRGKNW